MPIPGIVQPEVVTVDKNLRLRKFDGVVDAAFEWYQDTETVYLVDGVQEPYTMGKLNGMYRYLDARGELYFIEIDEGDGFRPIGDVCFWQDDMPMVIGDRNCRGKGIGRKVIAALIRRGRELGFRSLRVGEIYDFNTASRRCYESVGFCAYEKTEKGYRFRLEME